MITRHYIERNFFASQEERLIEGVEYARINKDQFSVNHQLQSGLLEDVGEVISDIRNTIQEVSNDICPD